MTDTVYKDVNIDMVELPLDLLETILENLRPGYTNLEVAARGWIPQKHMGEVTWDDETHYLGEAESATGRRYIMLCPMGHTSVSESSILITTGPELPQIVPADMLTPTGRKYMFVVKGGERV